MNVVMCVTREHEEDFDQNVAHSLHNKELYKKTKFAPKKKAIVRSRRELTDYGRMTLPLQSQ